MSRNETMTRVKSARRRLERDWVRLLDRVSLFLPELSLAQLCCIHLLAPATIAILAPSLSHSFLLTLISSLVPLLILPFRRSFTLSRAPGLTAHHHDYSPQPSLRASPAVEAPLPLPHVVHCVYVTLQIFLYVGSPFHPHSLHSLSCR